MPTSDAARHDLYTGLAELLGSERAETLMTHLPTYDPAEVATKADIAELRTDATNVGSSQNDRFDRIDDRFDRLESRFDELNKRLDRLFLTLVAGLFVVVAAMTSVFFATI